MKGYPVDLAASEQELFEKLDGQDVILLDINLNGRNVGEALLGRLRKDSRTRGSRIIAFTAHALPFLAMFLSEKRLYPNNFEEYR